MSNQQIQHAKLALSLLLLASLAPVLQIATRTIFSAASYSSWPGFWMMILTSLPVALVLAGAAGLIITKSSGYYMIYLGYLTSLVGTSWSYLPVPIGILVNEVSGALLLHLLNACVIALLLAAHIVDQRARFENDA